MSPEADPTMDHEAIIRVFSTVLRDPAVFEAVAADPDAGLAELGLDAATREAMLAHGPGRLFAYHRMVHSRLRRTVRKLIGPAAAVLGRERLHAEVDAWIDVEGPRSGIFRDVVGEFADWAVERWAADDALPPWLAPLAAHGALRWRLRNDPRVVEAPSEAKIDLERAVACNATASVQRYAWAVHRVPAEPGPEEAPEQREVAVAIFRDAKGKVRELELEPRLAAMLERLLAGQTLREALFGACEATGQALDDEILKETALALADWCERHLLLGGTE
ncbi:hypothetical protein PPSIR1_00150 [Plesiocystis pacifica SIR-1]|uniref:NGO1945-like C-terminal domain-containing protein n=1 Tax=Plesiocystis pacifica SIR-1 TaxID=391625 RepID=A6GEU5_9BACT|nr:hypothetical protein [Plesiocystis pacifica]EDM75607.1 hypothetical protein PPSIR1_00150 [Plesiocystis pacifica SIR-1]